MAETIIPLGSNTELHYDWQINPIGIVDIKSLADAQEYCQGMAECSESPAHFMTAVYVMYNAIAEYYNKQIDKEQKNEAE